MKTIKKRTLTFQKKAVLTFILSSLLLTINIGLVRADNERLDLEIKETQSQIDLLKENKSKDFSLKESSVCGLSTIQCSETRGVLFTNYYQGDGSSGTTTASGLTTSDFDINDKGFYTYQGKVVLATANTTRLNWGLNPGYESHELYEVITTEVNGQTYEAIVLDVCGACYGVEGETLQRYDIFTKGNVIGKVKGVVYE